MPAEHLFVSESVTPGHPDKPCDAIADATRECPPARGPCVFAGVVFPCIVVLGHRLAHSTWHWAKAVAEQVNAR